MSEGLAEKKALGTEVLVWQINERLAFSLLNQTSLRPLLPSKKGARVVTEFFRKLLRPNPYFIIPQLLNLFQQQPCLVGARKLVSHSQYLLQFFASRCFISRSGQPGGEMIANFGHCRGKRDCFLQ